MVHVTMGSIDERDIEALGHMALAAEGVSEEWLGCKWAMERPLRYSHCDAFCISQRFLQHKKHSHALKTYAHTYTLHTHTPTHIHA